MGYGSGFGAADGGTGNHQMAALTGITEER